MCAQLLTEIIRERLQPATIVERPDPQDPRAGAAGRALAGAALHQHPAAAASPPSSRSTICGCTTTPRAGQKTGAFLDQRLNYAAAASYARGRALDVCTYQGGFALHMAQRCDQVTGVDASRAALEVADRNLELNPDLRAKVDWIEADAFELLREYEAAGERYDTIVLDPPAFAKSKRAAEGALRGYKELNLRAIKMLQPRRDAGDLLLLAPCPAGGVYGGGCRSGCRCRAPRSVARDSRSRARSSGDAYVAGDDLSEVPDLPGELERLSVVVAIGRAFSALLFSWSGTQAFGLGWYRAGLWP